MIKPTSKDIGRFVIYTSHDGRKEEGAITSFNDRYVFVHYGRGSTHPGARREDLEWSNKNGSPTEPEDLEWAERPTYWVLLYVMPQQDKGEPWKWAFFPDVHAIYETEEEAKAVQADMSNPLQYWVVKCRWESEERLKKVMNRP
jgi:hypothetical protein